MELRIENKGKHEFNFFSGTKVKIELIDNKFVVSSNDFITEREVSTILNDMINLALRRAGVGKGKE